MATQTERAVLVRAAGVLPWRVQDGELQFALVHRPRYDDWSWPKGKLERGEEWVAAAVRETLEETGLQVSLGPPLPSSWYGLGTRDGRPQLKQVRYWAATVCGGNGALEHEIDEVTWLAAAEARERLTYRRDREQLDAADEAHAAGLLDTWPLLVVRHAHSVGRGSWTGQDADRPLTPVGQRRSARIIPLLAAYRPAHLLTSPSVRCADTLRPYAEQAGLGLTERKSLSEEGHAATPGKAVKHLRRVLERGESTIVCTHRPVIPDLLDVLARQTPAGHGQRMLTRLARNGLDKGEVLALQVAGTGPQARVVDVERHRPPA
ncbi:NUDIX hydrolase [Ornithinimicrobium cavernae]|uniref:NUDIX hydrolase n=1 Tax=Ornithinimicrobium cavernae TaxID=2666047 RepID=UPI001F27CA32|nr:NUDIX hydrolase [Ornithinimicrobium cavernae]